MDESEEKRNTVILSNHRIMYVFEYCKACDSLFFSP